MKLADAFAVACATTLVMILILVVFSLIAAAVDQVQGWLTLRADAKRRREWIERAKQTGRYW